MRCRHCGVECDTKGSIELFRERGEKKGVFWSTSRPLCLHCCAAFEELIRDQAAKFWKDDAKLTTGDKAIVRCPAEPGLDGKTVTVKSVHSTGPWFGGTYIYSIEEHSSLFPEGILEKK
jgi:hypothetical protein